MATVSAYLTFAGNCEEAFQFYKSAFGGDFTYVGRFGEIPESEEYKVSEEQKNKIMHISLPIGDTVLLGSDAGGEWASSVNQGNNFSIAITAESKEEANKLFSMLSDGGQVTMPLATTFWGDYFGMFTDKFGINWMVSFNEKGD